MVAWSCTSEYSYEVIRTDADRLDTLVSGGRSRVYEVHLPADYETYESPVVILFHGSGGDATDMKILTAFDVRSASFGFLTVYPNATTDWAYGCDCTEAEANGVDDVEFVADLIDTLDSDYGINRDSVFVVGYAEGAFMAVLMLLGTEDPNFPWDGVPDMGIQSLLSADTTA
jgi:poly(3-hydroxybutyrate) depolymerase